MAGAALSSASRAPIQLLLSTACLLTNEPQITSLVAPAVSATEPLLAETPSPPATAKTPRQVLSAALVGG